MLLFALWSIVGLHAASGFFLRPSARPRLREQSALYARRVVWYTSGDLRVHDNEALTSAVEAADEVTPLYVFDPAHLENLPPHTIKLTLDSLRDLKKSLEGVGSDLVVRVGPAEKEVASVAAAAEADSVWHYVDTSSGQRELVRRGVSGLAGGRSAARPWSTRLRSRLTLRGDNYKNDYVGPTRGQACDAPLPPPSPPLKTWLPEEVGRMPSFEELLSVAYAREEPLVRASKAAAEREEYMTPTYAVAEGEPAGETLALRWLEEYLEEGPEAFGAKHLPTTGDGLERAAIRRIVQAKGMSGLFEGEIFCRAFSPLLGLGCLSPRYVMQAITQRVKPSPFAAIFPPALPPVLADVQKVMEAREWHVLLAEQDLQRPPVEEPMEFRYWRWHGHLVRYAVSREAKDEGKPSLVLVHGFGASADQWAKCFRELSGRFNVFAIDMLGFGHSEKPPIHYTQYGWQDQVRDFALEIVGRPYFVAGNSIGGYTAMSVAADSRGLCQGLILINTAGRVVDPATYQAEVAARSGESIEDITRRGELSPLGGPPRLLLRGASLALFAYLQPRIEEICRNLYKKNPDEVGSRLVSNIFRDSCDPGALDVFASGARLPPPRPANELLLKFGGPVLVAQGVLDPLNDAKGRAELLRAAHDGVKVVAIEGGHCVHDEDPVSTARAISEFVSEVVGGFEKQLDMEAAEPAPA